MKRYGIYESQTRWQNGHYQSVGQGLPARQPVNGNIRFFFTGDTNYPVENEWLPRYTETTYNLNYADFENYTYPNDSELHIEKQLHTNIYATGTEKSLYLGTYTDPILFDRRHEEDYHLALLWKFIFATNTRNNQLLFSMATNSSVYSSYTFEKFGIIGTSQTATTGLTYNEALRTAVLTTDKFRYTAPSYIDFADGGEAEMGYALASQNEIPSLIRWTADNSAGNLQNLYSNIRCSFFCPYPFAYDTFSKGFLQDNSLYYNYGGFCRAFVGKYVENYRYTLYPATQGFAQSFTATFCEMDYTDGYKGFLRGLQMPKLYRPFIYSPNSLRQFDFYSVFLNGIVGMFVLADKYGRIRYEGDC